IERNIARKVALVGESFENIREVMVEGLSGLLAIASPGHEPRWLPSRHKLVWPNGAEAHCFSAADPDGLRGYQFDTAWSDELASWRKLEETWSNLQLTLRLRARDDSAPQQVITTTPRPLPALRQIRDSEITAMTHMKTRDNADNLAPAFLSQIAAQYEGTSLGAQELDGELLEDMRGAFWQREWLDEAQSRITPPLEQLNEVVIAIDPPATAGDNADECGIIVAGRLGSKRNGSAVVLADLSAGGLTPLGWAGRAASACHQYKADRIIVEGNQGGDMAVNVLRAAAPGMNIARVHATRGKHVRAEPVSLLYEQHRVIHAQRFDKLEEQLLTFTAESTKSPDRLDALVWALTELMVGPEAATPRVHSFDTPDSRNKR
ncbi:MAG: terminase family protein, partial [Aquisalinus sp.]|nr:terminase family protein [Aquisalinus sp.]